MSICERCQKKFRNKKLLNIHISRYKVCNVADPKTYFDKLLPDVVFAGHELTEHVILGHVYKDAFEKRPYSNGIKHKNLTEHHKLIDRIVAFNKYLVQDKRNRNLVKDVDGQTYIKLYPDGFQKMSETEGVRKKFDELEKLLFKKYCEIKNRN